MPMRFMHWYRKEYMQFIPCYEEIIRVNAASPENKRILKYCKAKNKLLREELRQIELDNILLANCIRRARQKHLKVPVK